MDLLAELNRLRSEAGKLPLRKWTGTEDQLKKAIIDRKRHMLPQVSEEELIAQYLAEGGDVKYGRYANAKGVRKQGTRRHRKSKLRDKPRLSADAARVITKANMPSDCFHITEISDEQGTLVRARARRVSELATLNVKELGRWIFRRKDWDTVVGLMSKR